MILDKLKIGEKFKLSGQEFTVTGKAQGYLIGCTDKSGQLHYLSRDQAVLKKDDSDSINFFKGKLKSHLYIKGQLLRFTKKLEGQRHKLYGLTKGTGSGIFESKESKIYRISQIIEELEVKISYFQYEYDIVQRFINSLDDDFQKVVKAVYIYQKATFEEIVRELNLSYSHRNIQYQIDKLITSYIKKHF